MIRNALTSDAAAIQAIYAPYVLDTCVSFECEVPSIEELSTRITKVQQAGLPWLVYAEGEQVLGYAYATPWKGRAAYQHSVEVSIYLCDDAKGKGIGALLYQTLFEVLREQGVHAAMAGITLPNPDSVRFHEKCKMHKVAHFKEVGRKFGNWIDVGYWQICFSKTS